MPKRPRSHELEDLAVNHVREIFTKVGWTIEDLRKDYGEDLLIRIFEGGAATHLSFFVQAKGTDHIEKYLKKSQKEIIFPIDTAHLKHWKEFWEPVVLTIWDSSTDTTYWESIQSFIESPKGRVELRKNKKYVAIRIPVDNVLNQEGIKRILSRTKLRFERLENERTGAQVLIELLEDKLDVKIEYAPQFGALFIKKPDGKLEVLAFGKCALTIERMSSMLGIPPEQVGAKTLQLMSKVAKVFSRGEHLGLADSKGNVVKSWPTFSEFLRQVRRDMEIQDIDIDEQHLKHS